MSITGGLQAEAMALWPPKPMSPKHDEVPRGGGGGQGTALPAQRPSLGEQVPLLPGHFNPQASAPAPAPLPRQGPPLGGPDWEVRDRLETQQEVGVGVSEKEADY